ncbi:MAG: hypothetical protein AAGL89_12825 [Pseudomonadota bacterium]
MTTFLVYATALIVLHVCIVLLAGWAVLPLGKAIDLATAVVVGVTLSLAACHLFASL